MKLIYEKYLVTNMPLFIISSIIIVSIIILLIVIGIKVIKNNDNK